MDEIYQKFKFKVHYWAELQTILEKTWLPENEQAWPS